MQRDGPAMLFVFVGTSLCHRLDLERRSFAGASACGTTKQILSSPNARDPGPLGSWAEPRNGFLGPFHVCNCMSQLPAALFYCSLRPAAFELQQLDTTACLVSLLCSVPGPCHSGHSSARIRCRGFLSDRVREARLTPRNLKLVPLASYPNSLMMGLQIFWTIATSSGRSTRLNEPILAGDGFWPSSSVIHAGS